MQKKSDMASYQSKYVMKAFPHQFNIGFDLGNIEVKERGLKSDTKKRVFSIRGKDWNADYILFIDHSDRVFYLMKASATTLGKRPKNKMDTRNILVNRIQHYAILTTQSEQILRKELKKYINPKFQEIIKDLDSPNFSIFEQNTNEGF